MDSVGNIGSRKRVAGNHYSAEEQALDQIAKEVGRNIVAKFQRIKKMFLNRQSQGLLQEDLPELKHVKLGWRNLKNNRKKWKIMLIVNLLQRVGLL